MAAAVGVLLLATAAHRVARCTLRAARWTCRSRGRSVLALIGTAAALYAVQVIVGALQITTSLAPWAVALHLALGALIWALVVAGVFVGYFAARTASPLGDDLTNRASRHPTRRPPSLRERVSAYVALTKPRIIELLLVTTVPAMVLAAHGIPRLDLVLWTLVGGTLAAGAANAINCYIDRDIDLLMTRTRRRPLPAHEVNPEDALVFGLVLGVLAFGVMAFLVNLVAAFLTLVAMAFYVVVYTMLLKRTTPQNIVLGGAAGALPPVIGWSAVTGDIGLPSLMLFAIVFYWTPPHFWALSLRLRRDYAAARRADAPRNPRRARDDPPDRPVQRADGLPDTGLLRRGAHGPRLPGRRAGPGRAVPAPGLPDVAGGTDARAVRLYRYSITYLTALFALIILDVFVFIGL